MAKKSLLGKMIKVKPTPEKSEEEFVFNQFTNLERELLPQDAGSGWLIKSEEGQLLVDIYKEGDAIVVVSAVAGVKPENLEISVSHDLLTIRGQRQHEDQVDWQNYYYQECYWGTFSRSIVLPYEVRSEGAKAILKNGVLKIYLPRAFKPKIQKIKIDEYED
ncbi:MAG: Hsp20/alpha crystallin family protein [Candidatus Buchananbacteria bacterium]